MSQPLSFCPETRSKIEKKVLEIVKRIMQKPSIEDISLMSGSIGVTLFLFYYARYAKNSEAESKAFELIEEAFEQISSDEILPSFSGGLAGIGWTIEHLVARGFFEADTEELFEDLDVLLDKQIDKAMEIGFFDFLHGGIGMSLYFLQKGTDAAKTIVSRFIQALNSTAIRSSGSICWESMLVREKNISGVNLSISHGISGILAFLASAHSKNIEPKLCKELIEGTIDYILANKSQAGAISIFPNWISNEAPSADSRLAWCYGDLGVAVAIFRAAKSIENKKFQEEAIDILTFNAGRKALKDNALNKETMLCHGTGGLAAIYFRMYLETKIPLFAETTQYWIDKTLEFAHYEDGIAGYKSRFTDAQGGWLPDFSFLEGVSGVGLLLVSVLENAEPTWDSALLLS